VPVAATAASLAAGLIQVHRRLDAVFAGADIRIIRTPITRAAGERDRRALD
jgi:hypothetical protein